MNVDVELYEAFDNAEQINIYNDGEVTVYRAGESSFGDILVGWKSLISGAHEMPAYGVSLNRETVKAVRRGLWIEFDFGKILESNGMPYEKLLINVEKEWQGFNLIRYNSKGGYDGRCFYYDLVGKNMSDFYDILLNL